MKIKRPRPSNLDVLRGFFEERYDAIAIDVNRVSEDPTSIRYVAEDSLDFACYGLVLGAEHSVVVNHLEDSACTTAAMFQAAYGELPVELEVDEYEITITGRVISGAADAWQWIQGFFLAWICRNSGALDQLCSIPTEPIRTCGREHPEFRYLLIDALRAMWNFDDSTSTLFVEAMAATDPEQFGREMSEFVLLIDVPIIQHFFYAIANDEVSFRDQFPEAVKLHKKYWTKNAAQKRHPSGFLSIGLTAAASAARLRKIDFEIDSDYVPDWLIELEVDEE